MPWPGWVYASHFVFLTLLTTVPGVDELHEIEQKLSVVEKYITKMFTMINDNSEKLVDNRQIFKKLKGTVLFLKF